MEYEKNDILRQIQRDHMHSCADELTNRSFSHRHSSAQQQMPPLLAGKALLSRGWRHAKHHKLLGSNLIEGGRSLFDASPTVEGRGLPRCSGWAGLGWVHIL